VPAKYGQHCKFVTTTEKTKPGTKKKKGKRKKKKRKKEIILVTWVSPKNEVKALVQKAHLVPLARSKLARWFFI
jgi:hypothetical protein